MNTRYRKEYLGRIKQQALLTDLYQLTMNAAYLDNGKDRDTSTFDLFIRELPKDWGYFVAGGIEDAVDYLTHLRFQEDDLAYLREEGLFKDEFLNPLKDFRFTGEVYALQEGSVFSPNTPVMRVTAERNQSQFFESALLNIVGHQIMQATKANRVVNAAAPNAVIDFSLRRDQGLDAALNAAKNSFIGGALGTSNVLAGKIYGIPIKGTHAHSFVMTFPTELDAFRAYVRTFPDKSTLLIDTYDTLQGARNAAVVAHELEERGGRLGAVRLDSGDLAELSKQVRKILDEEDLQDTRIIASNDLNEYKIQKLKEEGAKIDGYGVGTEMGTVKPIAAISAVYKIVEDEDGGKIKLSPGKKSYPGKKQVYRHIVNSKYTGVDTLELEEAEQEGIPSLELFVEDGERVREIPALEQRRDLTLEQVAMLPDDIKAIVAERQYTFEEGPELKKMREELSRKYQIAEAK